MKQGDCVLPTQKTAYEHSLIVQISQQEEKSGNYITQDKIRFLTIPLDNYKALLSFWTKLFPYLFFF